MPADMKTFPKNHLGALIAFAVAFILSLIGSYITVSSEAPDDAVGAFEASGGVQNAWWSWATIGMLLLIVGAAIVAVRAFAPHVLPAGVPWQLIALAAAALGTLLLILRAVTSPDSDFGGGFSVSSGPGWSAYALWIAAIAQTVFTGLGFRESGEEAPWQQRTADGTGTVSPGTGSSAPMTGGTTGTTGTTGSMPPAAGPTSSAPPPPPAPPPPSGPTTGPPPPPPA